jgi:hypothetical protein
MRGKQLHALAENERPILADRNVKNQRPKSHPPYLHTQAGQAIGRLAGGQGIPFEAADDLAEGPGHRLAPALLPGLLVNAANGLGKGARAVYLEAAQAITGSGYALPAARFWVSSRSLASSWASTSLAGIPSSISVYFCKSAAVKARRPAV